VSAKMRVAYFSNWVRKEKEVVLVKGRMPYNPIAQEKGEHGVTGYD